ATASAAVAVRGAADAGPLANAAGARHDGRGGRAAADRDDPRAHARQQDPRGGNPRHQSQDTPQQIEQTAPQAEKVQRLGDMRLGIKGKQVLGVTTIVALIVAALSLMHLAELARVKLDESRSRAELLANAVYHRAREVVASGNDPAAALAADPGLRSILESSLYSPNVTFAALVDVNDKAVAHADPTLESQPLRAAPTLDSLLASSSLTQLREIYAD